MVYLDRTSSSWTVASSVTGPLCSRDKARDFERRELSLPTAKITRIDVGTWRGEHNERHSGAVPFVGRCGSTRKQCAGDTRWVLTSIVEREKTLDRRELTADESTDPAGARCSINRASSRTYRNADAGL